MFPRSCSDFTSRSAMSGNHVTESAQRLVKQCAVAARWRSLAVQTLRLVAQARVVAGEDDGQIAPRSHGPIQEKLSN